MIFLKAQNHKGKELSEAAEKYYARLFIDRIWVDINFILSGSFQTVGIILFVAHSSNEMFIVGSVLQGCAIMFCVMGMYIDCGNKVNLHEDIVHFSRMPKQLRRSLDAV